MWYIPLWGTPRSWQREGQWKEKTTISRSCSDFLLVSQYHSVYHTYLPQAFVLCQPQCHTTIVCTIMIRHKHSCTANHNLACFANHDFLPVCITVYQQFGWPTKACLSFYRGRHAHCFWLPLTERHGRNNGCLTWQGWSVGYRWYNDNDSLLFPFFLGQDKQQQPWTCSLFWGVSATMLNIWVGIVALGETAKMRLIFCHETPEKVSATPDTKEVPILHFWGRHPFWSS